MACFHFHNLNGGTGNRCNCCDSVFLGPFIVDSLELICGFGADFATEWLGASNIAASPASSCR